MFFDLYWINLDYYSLWLPVARQWSYVGNILPIHCLSLSPIIGTSTGWNLRICKINYIEIETQQYIILSIYYLHMFLISRWGVNVMNCLLERPRYFLYICIYFLILTQHLLTTVPFNAVPEIQNNHCMERNEACVEKLPAYVTMYINAI